jgi:hypothetical protein
VGRPRILHAGLARRIKSARTARSARGCRSVAGVRFRRLPDPVLAAAGSTIPALLRATRALPIVFAQTPDPVGAGYIESLARPGGNVTGFTTFEYSSAADAAGIGQWAGSCGCQAARCEAWRGPWRLV